MAAVTSVTIIGLGSRGLGVLERVLSLAADRGSAVRIEVIDPVADGTGIHGRDQPDYLLLNTICSQVSMFPDDATVGAGPHSPGPSLYRWAVDRDLRVATDGFSVGAHGRRIRPTDFLPRRLLGDYLAWFFELLQTRVPAQVTLTVHRAEAVELDSSDGSLRIMLSDGTELLSDYAFLTTGYTGNRQAAPTGERLISQPYPMPDRFAGIAAGQSVAIAGFGLSAMDAMSCLTVGRGGRFVTDAGQLRYLPSGHEPRLAFYSRSGLACRARPRLLEYGPSYQPLVFTPAGIDALRSVHGAALDFDSVVRPLIEQELRIAYRRCQASLSGPAAVRTLAHRLSAAAANGELGALLDALDAEQGRLDPRELLDPATGMDLRDSTRYQDWLARAIRADLVEGDLGLAGSAVKGALDILRQLRDTFRYVVDFGGLTPRSLESFMTSTVPILNRAVVGPQYQRHAELVALLAAGVASIPFGPDPAIDWDAADGGWRISSRRLQSPFSASVDWLAAGWLELPSVSCSTSPLLDQLHRTGRIRAHQPGSSRVVGIDIDREQHPVTADGSSDRRIWVLGPLCEGATFYNNLVPSPNCFSRPVHDAHRCVTAMFTADRALPMMAATGGLYGT